MTLICYFLIEMSIRKSSAQNFKNAFMNDFKFNIKVKCKCVLLTSRILN